MPTPFNSAALLGGPMGGPMPPGPVPGGPVRLGGTYNNQYGTAFRAGFVPDTSAIDASFQFPIGDYRSGNYAAISGGHDPNQGYNVGVKFGKKRNPKLIGEDVYNFGFEANQQPRFAGDVFRGGVPENPPSFGGVGVPGFTNTRY